MVKETNAYIEAKALKLAKNRKPSDVFSSLNENSPLSKPYKAKQTGGARTFLNVSNPSALSAKKARKKRLRELVQQIRVVWPHEKITALSKKQCRTVSEQYEGEARHAFMNYVNSCRRALRHQRKLNRQKKNKLAPSPRRLQYDTYINSPMWETRKNQYYQKHSRRCAACSTAAHIQLHHMDYSKIGREPDEHLIPLCGPHHLEFHERYGTKKHMIRETALFIQSVRSNMQLT